MARLSVIVVNYNSWPDVIRLVDAIVADPDFCADRCEIVVVDNGSQDPIPAELAQPRSGVRLVARLDNGGFAVGVNTGWRESIGQWLLLLNPDVEPEPGFLGQVLDCLDKLDQRPSGPPGIVGFGLRNPDGTQQGSVGVFPSLSRTFREQFIPRVRRKYQADWRIKPGGVDWVTGACMLVNRAMIADVGGMDEDFFLYHEEVAFSRVAQDRGWSVEYDPVASIIHHSPLQGRQLSPKMCVITRHSKLLYFLKHLPRWQFLCLFGIVTGEAWCRRLYSTVLGREDRARAWKVIGQIARNLRRGHIVRGREVLWIAEFAERGSRPAGTTIERPDTGLVP